MSYDVSMYIANYSRVDELPTGETNDVQPADKMMSSHPQMRRFTTQMKGNTHMVATITDHLVRLIYGSLTLT